MTRPVFQWTAAWTLAATMTAAVVGGGCRNSEGNSTSSSSSEPSSQTKTASGAPTGEPTPAKPGYGNAKDDAANLGAGGAPTYGEPTGTGFPTGDAAHSGGQGSGLLGYHGTGAAGTSAAISDMHPAGDPPKGPPQWVLPEQ